MNPFAPHSATVLAPALDWAEQNTIDTTELDPLAQRTISPGESLVLNQPQLPESFKVETDMDRSNRDEPDPGDPQEDQRPSAIIRLRANSSKRLKQVIRGKKQRVIGTDGNDRLDASKGKGRNQLLGKGGNDRLKGKRNDRLLGGPGRDRLDTRKGRQNILKGGGGNDMLFAGKRDKLFGNGGADTLNASKGKGRNTLKGGGGPDLLIGKMGDRLVGGNGKDEFVLINRKLPTEPLIVQDFQPGGDRLSLRNAPDNLSVSDLAFRQQGANTVIAAQGQDIAILENVTANQLTTADFTNPAPEAPSAPVSPLVPPILPVTNDTTEANVPTNDSATSQNPAPVTIQHRNQYSIRSLDAPTILLQFGVSGLNPSNTVIPDSNPSLTVGLFSEAIQNYVSGNGTLPFGVDPTPFVPDGAIDLNGVDLRAELVQDPNRNAFVTNGRDTIEYVFTNPNPPTPNNTAHNTELLRLNLDFTSQFFAGVVPNFDLNQAINSIEYIVENDLFAYTTRVQVAGTQLFSTGDVQNTQPSKTYRQSGNIQFRLVGRQQDLAIEDQNDDANAGLFVNAIEAFRDEGTGQSFPVGNLSTSLTGDEVTYAIATTTFSHTATLSLIGTSFDPDLAVNNLPYIFTNDLLKLAFFDH